MTSAAEKVFFHALASWPRQTPARLRLLKSFPSWEEAWRAPLPDLLNAGLDGEIASDLAAFRRGFESEEEFAKLEAEGISFLLPGEKNFPKRLEEIDAPPAFLFAKGEILPRDAIALAVVGSRAVSEYGRRAVEKLVEPIAAAGVTIVSGLALGTDALAHEAALAAGGRTLAFLANGLDSIHPATNRRLAEKILKTGSGALLSEKPLGGKPEPHDFPIRNRLIAGSALGTLVIEAAEKSGSLITARLALDAGREVFAVPGSIFSKTSGGTNLLLKTSAARPVSSAEEILDALKVDARARQVEFSAALPEDPLEKKVFAELGEEPRPADEIARATGIPSAQVAAALTMMEMRGQAKAFGGGRWARG
jgi:DNA processing protein